jgi:hypothetical protein
LLNHPAGNVRGHFVHLSAGLLGERVRPVLDRRLVIETDELVRQQINDTLRDLSVS